MISTLLLLLKLSPQRNCVSYLDYLISRSNPNGTEGGESPVVGGPKLNPQQMAAQKRLQQTQAQVNEVSLLSILILLLFLCFCWNTWQVVGIMRVNVEKVLERDQKLSELDDRAGIWQDLKIFKTTAKLLNFSLYYCFKTFCRCFAAWSISVRAASR